MPSIQSIEPHICPLCGQPNQCAMEALRATGVKQPPCWCSQLKFDAELLERIPEQARGKACICASCAQSIKAVDCRASLAMTKVQPRDKKSMSVLVSVSRNRCKHNRINPANDNHPTT